MLPQNQQTDVTGPDGTTVRRTFLGAGGSKPSKVRDQNNREWNYVYNWVNMGSVLERTTDPEGNYTLQTYTGLSRQPTEVRRVAKPGSGLPDLVATATYTAPCTSNPKLCEKPLTRTDAKGSTTTFTYDTTHGGVLTETGPAVGGVAPQKRYEYAQRYAWVQNATNSAYVQAATPVWLLVRERYCKTTAASGASCAGGAGDEVVTDYDYGPNSGPNILLLRGVAVTADGQTLRSCYGYDAYGRKVSETKPGANLASCP
jgi:YD repeat-containing protein